MKKFISITISLVIVVLSITVTYAEEVNFTEYNGSLVDTLGPIEYPDTNRVIIDTNNDVVFDEVIEGELSADCKKNEYSFSLDESGTIFVDFSAEGILGVYLNIYSDNGDEIWEENPWWDSTSEFIAFNESVELTAGTYTFYVSEYSGYGDYELTLSFEAANETFFEEQNGSNNTFKTADEIEVSENYVGHLAENDKSDNYVFTLEQSGGIDLTFTADGILGVYLNVYDEKGQKIWNKNPWWDSTSEHIACEEYIALTTGTYYFSVSEYSGLGVYDFELPFTSANEDFEEQQNGSNNTFKEADEIECNSYYNGQIANNDSIDIYSFSISETLEILVSLTANNMQGIYIDIYDSKGKEIWAKSSWFDSTTGEISFEEYAELQAGDYYISISENSGVGEYTFAIITDDTSITTDDNDKDNDSENNEIIELECPHCSEILEIPEDEYNERESIVCPDCMKFIIYNGEDNKYECSNCGGTFYYSETKIVENGKIYCLYCDEIVDEDNVVDEFLTSDWAAEEVYEAYQNGLIPDEMLETALYKTISREEFAAIAVKLYENIVGEVPYADINDTPFTDCNYASEYNDYIAKAYELGITKGTSDTTFSPYENITREQLATMLCRTALLASGEDFDIDRLSRPDLLDMEDTAVSFADENEISDFAKASVHILASRGIIKGVDEMHFAPKETATREQSILISLRIFNTYIESYTE